MMAELPLAANGETLAQTVPDSVKTAGNLPRLKEWAFDFETKQFKTNESGKMYTVSGNEALKIWLYWAITTQLGRYRANSSDYGVETERFIGLPITAAIKSSELERTVREAIKISPYVEEIASVEISAESGHVVIDVVVNSVYEEGWCAVSVKV